MIVMIRDYYDALAVIILMCPVVKNIFENQGVNKPLRN